MTPVKRTQWAPALGQLAAILLLSAALALGVNALRPGGLPLVGDWSPAARMSTDDGRRLDIPLEAAEMLFYAGAAVFLDARPAQEYARGHIEGARSLPWAEVEQRLLEATGDLDPDAPIITYCDGELCSLSLELARYLIEAGFTNVRVLVNGWSAWRDKGLPVARAGEGTVAGGITEERP